MRRKPYFFILLVLIISIVLIGYSLFIEYREKPYDDYIFSVSIQVDNREMTIYPYQEGSTYFFLLPSYSRYANTYIVKNKKHEISLNDIELSSRNIISDFEENTSYKILDNNEDMGNLIIMFGSDIPTLYIETNSGNPDRIMDDRDIQEPASLTIINNGKVDYHESIEYISSRGNHSWYYEKKSLGFKLVENASLLGMKSYDRWILTSNMFDDTMGLRNYIAYNMANEIGMKETSDFRFVDVYLDKMYQGTYLLFERIGQSKEKLDIGDLDLLNNKANDTIEISKLKPVQEFNTESEFPDESYRNFNSPKDISGGYIIERNALGKTGGKENLFTTSYGETFVIRYPSFVNKEEKEYIENIVEIVNRALHADDYIDPITKKKLDEIIDVESFVLKYLIDEVTKNEGAGATSAYYYKKQGDDKLYAGPVWDYDKSLGRYYEWAHPDGIANAMLYKYDTPSDWYDKLYNNSEVKELIIKYYKERIKPFLDLLDGDYIEKQADVIRNSYAMNYIVWEHVYFRDDYSLPYDLYEHVGDLDYSINYIKWWVQEREDFLDKEWKVNDEHKWYLFISHILWIWIM